MGREISQRELRNDSGAILRAVAGGQTFVVTRNGTPMAELRPLRRRTFVPWADIVGTAAREPALDARRFRADVDRVIDQGLLGDPAR